MLKRKLTQEESINAAGIRPISRKGKGACSRGRGKAWFMEGMLYTGLCIACLIISFIVAGKSPVAQAAVQPQPWQVSEVAVTTSPGDQLSPSIAGTRIVFNDKGASPEGWVAVKDLADPSAGEQYLYGPGILAGPALDGDAVAWQDADARVCLRSLVDEADSCVISAAASTLALAGTVAVTSEGNGGSTISRINFETGRSRKLDSHAQPDMRFDPDIDGNQAVWVKMRGYGASYYEPLIVTYDVTDDTWSYLTLTGGGGTEDGESIYERRRPSVSGGRVLYQQRLNQAGSSWDIYEAVADTFGAPIVESPGDQVNPSMDGDLVVYQDNRNGHMDGAGGWVDEWDIYIMDLGTGREQQLVAAPGDQVNPVIRGTMVVWEDNRNGDWDIYAAEISPTGEQQAARPDLTLSKQSAFWDSYQAYTARELSVDYSITNRGEGVANSVTLAQAVCEPATVNMVGPMPASLPVLAAGQAMPFRLGYTVPDGVGRFKTRLFASCADADGVQIWYPGPPPL